MNNKVKELVEWVAKLLIWMPDNEMKRSIGTDLAKQILSHPDLALIVKGYEETVTLTWVGNAKNPLPSNCKVAIVIPLVEALKEISK